MRQLLRSLLWSVLVPAPLALAQGGPGEGVGWRILELEAGGAAAAGLVLDGQGGLRPLEGGPEVPEPWWPAVGEAALGPDGSGVRVLGRTPERVRIEAWSGGEARPAGLAVERRGTAVRLAWEGGPGPFLVTRRGLEPGAPVEELARVEGREFVDEEPRPGAVLYGVVAEGAPRGALGLHGGGRRPLEEGLELATGMGVDLLAGEERGRGAHLEVRYVGDGAVFLETLDGTRLAESTDGGWLAPAPESGSWLQGSQAARAGQELYALLPEGLCLRLAFEQRDGGMVLLRDIGPRGGARLPRPPARPELVWKGGEAWGVFPRPAPGALEDGPRLVVELEQGYRSGTWRELVRLEPGESSAALPGGLAGELARLRGRWVEAGWSSRPGPVLEALVLEPGDVEAREAAFRGALARLASAPYQERRLGHGTLVALGPTVTARVRGQLETTTDPRLARNLTQVLAALEEDGEVPAALVLGAFARELGIASEAPAGWLDPDPLRRGRALLAEVRDGARLPGEEQQHREWLTVLSSSDPDPGVASLARLALERPRPAGRRLPDGVPAALVPPSVRPAPSPLPDPAGDRQEARARLLTGLDAHRPRAALVELMIAERLDRPEVQEAGRSGVARLADALSLLEHHRSLGDGILVEAAEALVAGPRARLVAWRELAARRLSWPAPVDLATVRPRRVLEEASYEALARTLDELAEEGANYIDLVLPPGRYAPGSGSSWLELDVPGLRLLGEGEVVIEAGLRVLEVPDVVLEGLSVEHASGAGLYLAGGSVTLVDVRLSGTDSSATLVGGWLEGERVELLAAPERRGSTFSVRMQERCALVLRDSLVRAGGLFASGDSLVVLEGCVVDAGERHAVQSTRGGRVVLRDVWLRGVGGGLHGVAGGQLEGVLLEVARDPLGVPVAGIELCPEHVRIEAGRGLEEARWLPACPLEHR